ncbi:MAG: FHA domain-containing protein, partial [Candidatus Aminicenantes bacterium]|nr:FHA domain-containing protein [Candidatus Aminicenantes bacterium]
MKYLMYYMDGFVKKFPLDKPEITIGWNKENDLSINNELISGYHLKIDVRSDSIKIHDLNSTNGTYYSGVKVRESVIRLGDLFSAGSVEFLLKEGDLDEFRTSEKLIPIFNKIREESETSIRKRKTKYIKNIFEEILKHNLKAGVRKHSVSELLFEVSNYLSNISDLGSIFIITKTRKGYDFPVTIRRRESDVDKIEKFLVSTSEIFESETIPGKDQRRKNDFYSFPFFLVKKKAALIYVQVEAGKTEKRILEFLRTLTKEIELISKMIEGNERVPGKEEVVVRNGDIVGGSKIIKNLIKQ